jgi:hypothetical protein
MVRIFEPKRCEVTEDWRILLHIEEHHDLYSPLTVIRCDQTRDIEISKEYSMQGRADRIM